jgi:hypothetical protein
VSRLWTPADATPGTGLGAERLPTTTEDMAVFELGTCVLHQQGSRELPQGGRPTGLDQCADQQWLIDVAHPHPSTDELDDLVCRLHPRTVRQYEATVRRRGGAGT